MSRRKQGRQGRLPRTAPRPWIDARVLLVAALIASPAAYRSSQGLLPTSAALDRFLVIAVGCVVLSVVVRAVWPLVVGSEPPPPTKVVAGVAMPVAAADALDRAVIDDAYASVGDAGTTPAPARSPLDALALPPVGSGLDLFEEDVDPTALLELDR